jgi:hypothetical protein
MSQLTPSSDRQLAPYSYRSFELQLGFASAGQRKELGGVFRILPRNWVEGVSDSA